MTNRSAPRWAKWKHVPRAEVWEAVALSCGYEPEYLREDIARGRMADRGFGAPTLTTAVPDEFYDRLDVVIANLGVRLKVVVPDSRDSRQNQISLVEFANFAESCEWHLPPELRQLANAGLPPPAPGVLNAIAVGAEPAEFYNDPHWNFLQVVAWVTTRDSRLVDMASDNFKGQQTHYQEVTTTSGRRMAEVPSGPINWLYVTVWAAHQAISDGTLARPTEAIEREIVGALETGRLPARGIEIGKGIATAIPAEDWAYLELCEDERLGICARNKGTPHKYELRFSGLKSRRDDVLLEWPRLTEQQSAAVGLDNVILFPAGSLYWPVAELPELIAQALVPEVRDKEPRASYLIRYPIGEGSSGSRGEPLDEVGRQIFDQVCADLPRLPDHATAQDLQPYLDKFNAQSSAIGWTVGACWKDPVRNAVIDRQNLIAVHRAATTRARRDGQLRTVSPTSRLPVDENQADAEATVADFKRYVVQFGIDVRVAPPEFDDETKTAIASLLHWDERLLEALCFGFPRESYSDAVVTKDERDEIRQAIQQACADGRMSAVRTGTGNPLYGGEWRIERLSAVRWAVGRCAAFPDWLANDSLSNLWAHQDAERRAEGRFTLEEACDEIARNTGESAQDVTEKLAHAAKTGSLPVYRPGSKMRFHPERVRPFHDEAYGDELNHWLDTNEPRIAWRFSAAADAGDSRSMQAALQTCSEEFFAGPEPDGNEPQESSPADSQLDHQLDACSVDDKVAALFDLVGFAALEKMFPSDGKWKVWADKARANGLVKARTQRAMFNPYLAAQWWIERQRPPGWDWARCVRVLANNLPPRSLDEKYRLTGAFD